MKKTISQKGFTLIELIIVMVILGIMAAIAVPRYLDSIENAEASAEDAVISAIEAGLKQYANNSLLEHGQETWPENPFDALADKPAGYTTNNELADTDGEWTFDSNNGQITHQRADNSRFTWDYDYGIGMDEGMDDEAEIGFLDERVQVAP